MSTIASKCRQIRMHLSKIKNFKSRTDSAENATQLKRVMLNQTQFNVNELHSSQLLVGFQSTELVKSDVDFISKPIKN